MVVIQFEREIGLMFIFFAENVDDDDDDRERGDGRKICVALIHIDD